MMDQQVIETPAILGEIAVWPRVDGCWGWSVVVNDEYPAMSFGGTARSRVGAFVAAVRVGRREIKNKEG